MATPTEKAAGLYIWIIGEIKRQNKNKLKDKTAFTFNVPDGNIPDYSIQQYLLEQLQKYKCIEIIKRYEGFTQIPDPNNKEDFISVVIPKSADIKILKEGLEKWYEEYIPKDQQIKIIIDEDEGIYIDSNKKYPVTKKRFALISFLYKNKHARIGILAKHLSQSEPVVSRAVNEINRLFINKVDVPENLIILGANGYRLNEFYLYTIK